MVSVSGRHRVRRSRRAGNPVAAATGDTGPFDSVLAADQRVQEDREPGRVNSVVLFAD
jgi:hypothetical protein